MKTFRIIGFALVATLLCLSACSGGGDDPVDPTPKPEVVKSEITIDSSIISNGLSFTNEQGEQSISFTTNESWTLSVANTTSGATWCTASATSGTKGSASVKFTVTENTDYEDRSVSVTIKSGTASKTFTISQKGVDALLLTTDKYEVSQEGGTIEVEVKANIDYQMEISEDAKDWIKESSSRALTTKKHQLEIAMNEESEKREGEVYFKSGDKVETVKIYQAGGAIILLSQNEYTVSDAGDTISVEIKSNVEFGVQMPDVDWIVDEASSRGLSSHTLKYIVKANEEYDARSASIVFYDKNSELKDTLKVIQTQKDAIVVAKNEYTIESTGGELKFEVNANVEFEVSTSVDWIKQNTESRGLEATPLNFTIAENTTEEAREGIITISSGDLKQEIKVVQKTKSVFSLSETAFNITSEGGEFKVEVSTNGEYTITMPEVDWLSENKSRATSGYAHTFTVLANETYDAREAEIVFTHKETEEVLKVKVVQAQKDAIVISENVCKVKADGETVKVKVAANVEFEVIMPEVDWITQVESRGLTEHMLYFKVEVNETEEPRSAKILFTNNDLNLTDSVTINQRILPKGSYENGVVTINTEGTLKDFLGDDYLEITSLKIVGPINGSDIYNLRRMLAASSFKDGNTGKLTNLDLSEAILVEGGKYLDRYISISGDECFSSDNMIGCDMFERCTNLQNIILPKGITSIEESAFNKCKSLESITIGEGVTAIKQYAFYECESLASINIPNSVTTIGTWAFNGCKNLKEVTIGNGVMSIGKEAFSYTNVESVYIEDLSAWCRIEFNDITSNPRGKLYLNNEVLTELVVPNDVTEIKGFAFYSNKSLTKVSLGNNVKSIGKKAFYSCNSLVSIELLSDSLTTIGNEAFSSCNSLASIELSDNLTSIGYEAFYWCRSLTSVVIPDKVSSIGIEAFQECTSLVNVTLGNGITTIGEKAFMKSRLTSLKIPRNVVSIGQCAFYYTDKSECYSYAVVPPTLISQSFYDSVSGKLYVPAGSLDAYKASDWVNFFEEIVEME